MESLDKLREWLPNSLMLRTCEAACRAYLDEIEREIEEKYMEMPVDRDGVSWHIGDKFPLSGVDGKKHICTVSGVNDGEVFFYYDEHASSTKHRHFIANVLVHDKPRTIEDVLQSAGVSVAAIEDVAAEIRELMEMGE